MAEREPSAGEVHVRLVLTGVNPGDTKKRGDWLGNRMPFPRVVPHSDGSGVIDAVGQGVDRSRIGDRVWVYGAQSYRPFGTAAAPPPLWTKRGRGRPRLPLSWRAGGERRCLATRSPRYWAGYVAGERGDGAPGGGSSQSALIAGLLSPDRYDFEPHGRHRLGEQRRRTSRRRVASVGHGRTLPTRHGRLGRLQTPMTSGRPVMV
jgi:hypothetical protein